MLMCEEVDGLNGLDEIIEENIEAAWESEFARRTEELDTGEVKTVSWTNLRNRLAAKLLHGG